MLKKVLVIFVCMLLFCANAGADDIKQRYAVITHDKEIAKALYILEQTTGEKYIKVLRGRNSSKQPIKIQFRNFNTLSYDHHNLYAFVKKEDEFWYIYINAELIDEPPAALAPLIAGKTIHGDTNFQLDRKIASAKIEAEVWTKVLQKYPDSANGISELVNYEDELKAAYEKGTLQDYAEWHIKVIQNKSAASEINSDYGPDFEPYMRNIQRQVKSNWNPPKSNESKRVVLLFTIAKDGKLLSCSVFKSSGFKKMDKSAIAAVEKAAPFKPLPEKFDGKSVDIQFTLDYHVLGSGR